MEAIRRAINEKALPLLRILHVEPFILLFVLAASTKSITQTQLLQDKLCVDVFNQTREFCFNMNNRNLTDDESQMKSRVLSFLSQYRFYEMVIARLPRLLWPLALGSWSDRYIHGRKVMMAAASLGTLLEIAILLVSALAFEAVSPLVVLFAVLPSGLLGGFLGLYIGAYSYIGKNTPPHLLGIRFALLEVWFAVAWPMGTYLGGQLLACGVSYTGGQLRTYSYVFGTALVFEAMAFLWVIVAINERKLKPAVRDGAEQRPEDGAGDKLVAKDLTVALCKPADRKPGPRGLWKPLKLLFDLSNVVDMWRAVTKRRPDGGRLQVWLLTVALATHVFVYVSTYGVHFQFVQKVYNWDAVFISNVSAYESVLIGVVMLVGFPVLEKVLRIPLPFLAIYGSAATVTEFALRGSWLVPTSYFVSMAFHCCNGFPVIVLRVILSTLLPPLEIGKVYSFLELVKAVMPLASSAIFTPIFKATIDTNIGLSYQISAGLALVQVAVFIYAYLANRHKRRGDVEMKQQEVE